LTLAPKLSVDDARLDWTTPAVDLEQVVRACNPSPMAWTTLQGERFLVLRARAVPPTPGPGVASQGFSAGQAVRDSATSLPVGTSLAPDSAPFADSPAAAVAAADPFPGFPGEVVVTRRAVVVGTGTGLLELLEVQPQGRRPMPAGDWARGRRGEPVRFA
jgi:methionyl-tRNA formyltransferase